MSEIQWAWPIAVALFFAGLGGGSFIASAAAEFTWRGRYKVFSRVAAYISVPALALGILILGLDLGRPERATNVFNNPTSIMTIGAALLSTTIPIALVSSLCFYGKLKIPRRIEFLILGVGAILAFGVTLYTGLLLGILMSRPFWFTPVLPWLFVLSSLSTGLGAVELGVFRAEKQPGHLVDTMRKLEKNHVMLLTAELIILTAYLATVRAPRAVQLLLTGSLSGLFVGGVLIVGLLLPLGLSFYSLKRINTPLARQLALTSSVLVLAGGLLLRYAILAAGQL